VRRPHPRFDEVRNAWVTRAGGKLKILAKGPQDANTEAVAWDAFYVHMAKLGNPVQGSSLPVFTLGQLADKYGEWMQREVAAGRMKPRTLDYYQDQMQKFLDAIGGNRPAVGLLPHEVEMYKTGWHSVQAVQRLYNWGVVMGLLGENPIRSVKKPRLGHRQRILSPVETAHLLRGTDRHFRPFLLAMRHTIARPQEGRRRAGRQPRFPPALPPRCHFASAGPCRCLPWPLLPARSSARKFGVVENARPSRAENGRCADRRGASAAGCRGKGQW
jgi:hypothetical protein